VQAQFAAVECAAQVGIEMNLRGSLGNHPGVVDGHAIGSLLRGRGGHLRFMHQRGGGTTGLTADGDADAGADVDGGTSQVKGRNQSGKNPFGQPASLVPNVFLSQALFQAPRNAGQHLVAHLAAQAFVDHGEAINGHHQHGKRRRAALVSADGDLKPLNEEHAIGQLRSRIVQNAA
jgi:hypothetical protein